MKFTKICKREIFEFEKMKFREKFQNSKKKIILDKSQNKNSRNFQINLN